MYARKLIYIILHIYNYLKIHKFGKNKKQRKINDDELHFSIPKLYEKN